MGWKSATVLLELNRIKPHGKSRGGFKVCARIKGGQRGYNSVSCGDGRNPRIATTKALHRLAKMISTRRKGAFAGKRRR